MPLKYVTKSQLSNENYLNAINEFGGEKCRFVQFKFNSSRCHKCLLNGISGLTVWNRPLIQRWL